MCKFPAEACKVDNTPKIRTKKTAGALKPAACLWFFTFRYSFLKCSLQCNCKLRPPVDSQRLFSHV